MNEFKKSMFDLKISDFSEQELGTMFNHFDKNRDGRISYSEFTKTLRGVLSEQRLDLIERVFRSLDAKAKGWIDFKEMLGAYNSRRHPDVISGRKG